MPMEFLAHLTKVRMGLCNHELSVVSVSVIISDICRLSSSLQFTDKIMKVSYRDILNMK